MILSKLKKIRNSSPIHIPESSLAVYNLLISTNYINVMTAIVAFFKEHFPKEETDIVDLGSRSGSICYKTFIKGLDKALKNLRFSVQNKTPYSTLYGDAVLLQSNMQIILAYYQKHLKHNPSSKMNRFFKALEANEHNDEKNKQLHLYKHTTNYIKWQHMLVIKQFILQPLLSTDWDNEAVHDANTSVEEMLMILGVEKPCNNSSDDESKFEATIVINKILEGSWDIPRSVSI